MQNKVLLFSLTTSGAASCYADGGGGGYPGIFKGFPNTKTNSEFLLIKLHRLLDLMNTAKDVTETLTNTACKDKG